MDKPCWGLRVSWASLAVLLVILPIEGTAALRNLLLGVGLLAYGVHLHVTRAWRQIQIPLLFPWLLYAGIALLGLLWAVDIDYSLREIRHEILMGALVFWLAFNVAREWPWLKGFMGAVLLGNVLWVGFSLAVWFLGGTTKDSLVGTYHTGVGNYSTYLVTVIPVLVFAAWRAHCAGNRRAVWVLGFWIAANGVSLYATQNRQGFSTLILEVLVAAVLLAPRIRKPSHWGGFAMVLLLLLTVFSWQMQQRGFGGSTGGMPVVVQAPQVEKALASDGRLAHWKFAWAEALEHPLTGGGMGRETFKHRYPGHPMTSDVFVHTHNMLVNRLVQLGFPGLLAFLLLLGSLASRFWEQRRRSEKAYGMAVTGLILLAGVLAKNTTDDFFMRELGYLVWLIAGVLLGFQRREQPLIFKDRLHGLIPSMVRQAHHERNQAVTDRPELVEGLSENTPKAIGSILIIRRDNIGDLLCTTPLIRSLRQHYPKARIDALVNSYNAPVLAGNPDLNGVFAYTKAKHRAHGETVLGVHWRRLCLLWRLRRVGYAVVILAGDGNVERSLGLARWLAPGAVMGFAPTGSRLQQALDIPVSPVSEGHEVVRTFALLAPLGITGMPPPMVLERGALAQEESPLAQSPSICSTRTATALHRVVGIHISARKIPQRWPVERFAALIQALHAAEPNIHFRLFWSPGAADNPLHPGDDAKAAHLLDSLPGLPVEACSTPSLEALIAGLSACHFLICADGGAMHIGAALGLPVVCLFGNSDAQRWHPWGVPHALIQKSSRDVRDIEVAEVLAAYQTFQTP